MTIWRRGKSSLALFLKFCKSEEAHRVDIEVGECGGGCGVLELSGAGSNIFTFKREKIKERKSKGRWGGFRVFFSVWEASRYLRCVLMWSTIARHTFPSLFPLVLLKLNGLCFKNTALSKTPLKLSFPFFLCSCFVLLINIMCLSGWSAVEEPWEGDWLEVIPERGWKRKDAG